MQRLSVSKNSRGVKFTVLTIYCVEVGNISQCHMAHKSANHGNMEPICLLWVLKYNCYTS